MFLIMCVIACKTQPIIFYHGYLYNNDKQPLKGLILKNGYDDDIKAVSDENGYFKINKENSSINLFIYLYNDELLLDSIQVVRTHPERKPSYHFINGRKDTLFISNPN